LSCGGGFSAFVAWCFSMAPSGFFEHHGRFPASLDCFFFSVTPAIASAFTLIKSTNTSYKSDHPRFEFQIQIVPDWPLLFCNQHHLLQFFSKHLWGGAHIVMTAQ